MNLFAIAWKSIRQRRLASSLTALAIALGVMLMVIVLVMQSAVNNVFNQRSIAYELIVGPKGSDLQLVLSSVYRVQPPIENLPYLYYRQLQEDERVVSAVPLAFGDVTEEGNFPLVGTTTEYFENEYTPGKHFRIRGERIGGSFDAIIGSEVARQNKWDIGAQFTIKHGGAESDHVHDEKFTVVAVLAQTGTPNDRTVFLNIEGFYAIAGHSKPVREMRKQLSDFYAADPERLAVAMAQLDEHEKHMAEEEAAHADGADGHDHHHHHETPDAMKEVTAVLVNTRSATDPKNAFDAINLSSELKKGVQAMAVNPILPIRKLMKDVVGHIRNALVALTAMIIVVSGISILVSIYNSMSDRRREIGIMRALGAGRSSVFGIVLAESAILCIGGGLIGWLIGHGLAVAAAPEISRRTGLLLNPWTIDPVEFILFPVLLTMAIAVGFLPAMTAYRTDVADALNR